MQTQHKPFNTALLLASQFEMAAIDRQVLKGAEIRVNTVLTSGIEAATYLDTARAKDEQLPDFILCHEHLNDMTGKEFITLMRQHSDFMSYPIILAVSEEQKNPAGCSAILTRPYAVNELHSQIALAAQSQALTNTVLINTSKRTNNAFNIALAKCQTEQKAFANAIKVLYHEAVLAVRVKDFDKAIMHLQNCLRINAGYLPAQSALEKILELRARHRKKPSKQAEAFITPSTKKMSSTSLDQIPSTPLEQILSLDSAYIKEAPLDDSQNAPITLNPATKKHGKIRKLMPPLKEPSPPNLLLKFPKIHEAISIARITFSLLRRL